MEEVRNRHVRRAVPVVQRDVGRVEVRGSKIIIWWSKGSQWVVVKGRGWMHTRYEDLR